MTEEVRPEIALTIAGVDPSGGAGILADVRTFADFGFDGAAAITSLTFQNPQRVYGAIHQTGEIVRSQILPLLDVYTIAAVKTGMLPTKDVVMAVAELFAEDKLPAPVVDPVMVATSGGKLMEDDVLQVLMERLMPRARLVTPNIPEAERLTEMSISDEQSMRDAASKIRAMGPRAVLVKGGHLSGDDAIDVLDNEGVVTVFRETRVPNADVHGTGCRLSAAIAAELGRGSPLEEAVGSAKRYVWERLASTVNSNSEQ